MTETDKAYIAGLIDGEGYISIFRHFHPKRKISSYRVSVGITNTDRELILWLYSKLGGHFVDGRNTRDNWKMRYDVIWYSRKARTVLDMVLPYLKSKKLKAEIVLEFSKRRHLGSRNMEEKILDDLSYNHLKELNKRGRVIV